MKHSARQRTAAVLLATCMTVGLASCGGREETLSSPDGTPLSSDTGGPVSSTDGLDNSGKETSSTMTSQTTIAAPESSAPAGSETKSSPGFWAGHFMTRKPRPSISAIPDPDSN